MGALYRLANTNKRHLLYNKGGDLESDNDHAEVAQKVMLVKLHWDGQSQVVTRTCNQLLI